jgi:hypothetical protein
LLRGIVPASFALRREMLPNALDAATDRRTRRLEDEWARRLAAGWRDVLRPCRRSSGSRH